MNFNVSPTAPHPVTVNGVTYQLPRFLNPRFKEWVALRREAIVDRALDEFKDDRDARAKFLMFFQPPPVDIADIADETTTPDGAEYVVLKSCKLATPPVPDAIATALVEQTDPLELRALAKELASCKKAASIIRVGAGEAEPKAGGPDPLAEPLPTSGGSPTTSS